MSDLESNVIYTQDDELRFEEIVAQIHLQQAHTRRKSIMGVAEIFRVLKTKKHEYDCLGNSLINFLYGAEIVRIMIRINVSYVEDSDEVFEDFLKKELSISSRIRDQFVAKLRKIKSALKKKEPRDLRAECLDNIKSSEELVQTRYSSFITYFKSLLHQHRDIAAIVEVADELKNIKSLISTVMMGLSEKRKMVSLINFEAIMDFLLDDINHAIDVLYCQSASLAENIEANIEETNTLLNVFQLGKKSILKGKGKQKGVEGKTESDKEIDDGNENEDDQIRRTEISTFSEGDSEFQTENDSECTGEDDTSINAGEGDVASSMASAQKPLVKALVQCTLRKPVDRICFVSRFIRNYRENEEKAERKNEELRLLLAERERIQLRKQARQEEEMRKRMEEALRVTMQPEGEE